ncbi:MAG: helix-turn-helix transcriptional regulator [Hyphomonadaceae bacterium]|nr:helix-turn-helix transcriptional regulator [Hyphomonadaceae bacterium]
METRDPTLNDQTVGERIRKRRNDLEISQPELAEQIGVTYQQLQKYENGKNRISAGRLYDIAKVLKTSIAYFYEGLDPLHSAVRRGGAAEEGDDFVGLGDSQLVELVMAFRQIRDASARTSILSMVKKQAKAAGKTAAPPKSRKK